MHDNCALRFKTDTYFNRKEEKIRFKLLIEDIKNVS